MIPEVEIPADKIPGGVLPAYRLLVLAGIAPNDAEAVRLARRYGIFVGDEDNEVGYRDIAEILVVSGMLIRAGAHRGPVRLKVV